MDERAASLSKENLDSGEKTGQYCDTYIANEYNKDNNKYGQNLYSEYITYDPSKYGPINWIKSRT